MSQRCGVRWFVYVHVRWFVYVCICIFCELVSCDEEKDNLILENEQTCICMQRLDVNFCQSTLRNRQACELDLNWIGTTTCKSVAKDKVCRHQAFHKSVLPDSILNANNAFTKKKAQVLRVDEASHGKNTFCEDPQGWSLTNNASNRDSCLTSSTRVHAVQHRKCKFLLRDPQRRQNGTRQDKTNAPMR